MNFLDFFAAKLRDLEISTKILDKIRKYH